MHFMDFVAMVVLITLALLIDLRRWCLIGLQIVGPTFRIGQQARYATSYGIFTG